VFKGLTAVASAGNGVQVRNENLVSVAHEFEDSGVPMFFF
jgi:hypothetical protein